MNSQETSINMTDKVIDDLVKKTIDITENTLDIKLDNCIVENIRELLRDYLDFDKYNMSDLKMNSNSWGGGVWDLLCFYDNYDFKPFLIENYAQYNYANQMGRCVSPVYSSFPHTELNSLCTNTLNLLSEIKSGSIQ